MMSGEAYALDIVLGVGALLCMFMIASWEIVSLRRSPLNSTLLVSTLIVPYAMFR